MRSLADAFRDTVREAPVSYSVYSAFSFYGSRRGGELPGTWLISALGALGHSEAAVRQTLYRMETSQELLSRQLGREKRYRLSPYAAAEAGAGLAKIMDSPEPRWDGRWTLLLFHPGTETRVERERLREIATAEGFAALAPGLLVHPRERTRRLLTAGAKAAGIFQLFRAARVGHHLSDRRFVARHWHVAELSSRYRAFLRRYEGVKRMPRISPEQAFTLRFAVVFDFLEVAWSDPDLPPALLPRAWAGRSARALARTLYRRLLPGALRFADDVMQRVHPDS